MPTPNLLRTLRTTSLSKSLKPIPFTKQQFRSESTQPTNPASPTPSRPVSPHVGFYKTFAGPIAKVLLMATLTYQIAYWGWVKLEKDEERVERQAELGALESKLEQLVSKGK